jgi:hypothetical protein
MYRSARWPASGELIKTSSLLRSAGAFALGFDTWLGRENQETSSRRIQTLSTCRAERLKMDRSLSNGLPR